MAAIKLNRPPEQTGDVQTDLGNIIGYLDYLARQLNYVLNNLDEENIISKESEE
ncbi:MAG: hypothetical protein K6G85_00185 [Eubacterium sp.]|nr:hypothetical protein [Eubacterium sp.]